jgi:cytochrome P450 family 110
VDVASDLRKQWKAPGEEHHRMPGLPPGPRMNGWLQLALWLQHPIPFLSYCKKTFGDTFTIHLPAIGYLILTSDTGMIKDVFTSSGDKLHAGEANYVLEPIVGAQSILLSDGERHVRKRRLLLPPFRGERMQAYGTQMRDISEHFLKSLPSNQVISAHETMQSITLDIILHTVFGLEEGESRQRLRKLLPEALSIASNPLLLLRWFQVDLGPWYPWGRLMRCLKEVDEILKHQIAERQQRIHENNSDILSLMLEARDEDGQAMSVEEVRDELMTMLVAGHETTATALSWACNGLLEQPETAERAYTEIDQWYQQFGDGPAIFNSETMAQLSWIDACSKEALRLFPVIPGVGRVLKAPMTLGRYHLPAGVAVSPSIYLTHHDPNLWPDPFRFNPERFLAKKTNPYTFMPFGGGIRRCLGMAFALFEMKVVLTTLLRYYRLCSAPGHRTKTVRRSITFAPSHGMRLQVERRHPIPS